ncbi:MASE3 domain-containing protein [Desulfurivibrio sp. D14AmB]|uniref:MASE3 domain-containing protein n=1 Tax=Desulfurivibrio sp. D14AmB TaxID=3374370 RepID=UPI00376EFE97
MIKAGQGPLTVGSGLALALALLSLAIWSGLLPVPFSLAAPNYLAIHTASEILAVVVALLIFSSGYHSLDRQHHAGNLFLACAFLGVGLLDLLHTLAYPGMPDFITVNTNHKSISLWLAARLLAALALLALVRDIRQRKQAEARELQANKMNALELLRRPEGKNFALLLTDYSMPKIKGTELAAAAKVIRVDLPIIRCSGYSSGIDEEAAALGISALISKPLRQGELAREIRRVLDRPNG